MALRRVARSLAETVLTAPTSSRPLVATQGRLLARGYADDSSSGGSGGIWSRLFGGDKAKKQQQDSSSSDEGKSQLAQASPGLVSTSAVSEAAADATGGLSDVLSSVPDEEPSEVRAVLRSYRGSPKRLNDCASQIRGLAAHEAVSQLSFMLTKASVPTRKLLESAINNAEQQGMDPSELSVLHAYVGKGLVLKRMKFHGRGRRGEMHHKFSELTIVLGRKPEQKRSARV